MTAKPTRIRLGKTTPANQGSKYTSISCKPRKYQGALDGFGVAAAFAGSSNGACKAIPHNTRNAVKATMQINSE